MTLLLSEHIRKNWLLHFSAFFTWMVICFTYLNSLELNINFFSHLFLFVTFYVFFTWVVSSKIGTHVLRNKLFVFSQIIIVLYLLSAGNHDLTAILLVLVATQLPGMLDRKQALILMFSISVYHYFVYFNGGYIDTFFHILIYFVLQVFGFSSIEIMLREERAKEELAAINQELLAARYMFKIASQRQERLRISRDLHDMIGHQLTALSLNLEFASHKVPSEYKTLLQKNLKVAKRLLTDVRHVVKEMRNEEQFDLSASLNDLVAQLPSCQIFINSDISIRSLKLKLELMFCLQEGISNGLRHGKAREFKLDCQRKNEQLLIRLKDNGINVDESEHQRFGTGLKGMEERLAEFDGYVELNRDKNGCTLMLRATDNYD